MGQHTTLEEFVDGLLWKRNFRDALDQQTKQIDKLLEDLQEEKRARKDVAPKQEKPAMQDQRPVIQADENPYRVSFTKTGIEVSALLTDLASANELISTINALKSLLRPAASITPTSTS